MSAAVIVEVEGLKAKLSNGSIAIVFNERAMAVSLVKNGKELIGNLSGAFNDPDKEHSFYVDYHAEGKFRNMVISELRVIRNEENEGHIAYIDVTGLLYIEYHIILKKGDSGIYSYVIAKNNVNREFKLSELRSVYRFDPHIFQFGYTADRSGKQPLHEDLCKGEKIQDETYALVDGEQYTNGKVYSKYDYAGYYKDNPLWGQYGNGFGVWFIPVSTEYYPSGPMKQELLVHYNAIVLNYMTGAHFGTGDFYIQPGWEKMYGPWKVYVNCGEDVDLIADAAQHAREESKNWPYSWVKEELYPVARGVVKGKIRLTYDRTVPMMVVLAQAGEDLIRQKADYIFYSKTDSTGHFSLSNVRPGKYALYAYAIDGDITGELCQLKVDVQMGILDLGEIVWDAEFHRYKIWQIGTANRSAAEFKFGQAMRNYKWQKAVPACLDYWVGHSDSRKDWYYAQTKPGQWRIHFLLKSPLAEAFYLTIAIAAATKGQMSGAAEPQLSVEVNGVKVKNLQYINDSTIYRSALKSGWYHLAKIKLDKKLLRLRENTIALVNVNSAFMYDTILLECD